jgi:hypothetical protein
MTVVFIVSAQIMDSCLIVGVLHKVLKSDCIKVQKKSFVPLSN